jgi:hypothetical protein
MTYFKVPPQGKPWYRKPLKLEFSLQVSEFLNSATTIEINSMNEEMWSKTV